MRARGIHRFGAIVVSSCLLALVAGDLTASSFLRPEWQVGQDRVSQQDLQVISPSAAPERLPLEEAVQLALRQNLGFRRTVQALLAARSNWYAARRRWALAAFAGLERTGNADTADERTAGAAFSYAAVTGADISVSAELSRLDSEDTAQAITASLRQPLLAGSFAASEAHEQVRQARNSYRAALLSFFRDRQDLVESVISAYFDAVEQQQLVAIQDSSVRSAEQAVGDAELRLEAKIIPEIDLNRAQLRLSREKAAAVTQRQGLQDATDRLLVMLGLQVGRVPELVTTVSYQPQPLDAEVLISRALELRPDLRLADLGIEDRQAQLRLARSERSPALDLFGGWSRERNGAKEKSWNIGLDLSVPIGSRALTEAVRQARWGLLVSQQEREQLRQQVIADVRRQVRAAEAAQANVEIAAQGVEVAKRSVRIAQRMVEEALATNRDLLEAQDDLKRSESQLVSSKISYYLALVRLKVAVGQDAMESVSSGGGGPESQAGAQPAPSQ